MSDTFRFDVTEKVDILIKQSFGFPSTDEDKQWYEETAIEYNDNFNGENLFLDTIVATPDFDTNGTVRTATEVGLSESDFYSYSANTNSKADCSIVDDSTGTVRRFKFLILDKVPATTDNKPLSWYKPDSNNKNILQDTFQFNFKQYVTAQGDLIQPFLYKVYTQNSVVNNKTLPSGNKGGNYAIDLKSGVLFFPDYDNFTNNTQPDTTLQVSDQNKPILTIYKYIGRKGVSKQISVKDNTGSVTDPENNQIVVQTSDNTIHRYETNTNKWVAIGGSGGGSGTATAITSQNSINLLSGENSDWYKVGDDLDGSPGDEASFNSLSKDGKTIVVGHYQANPNYSGKVVVYQLIGSNWTQKGSILTAGGGWAGYSVDISSDGTIVAYSSQVHDPSTSKGTVTVFRWKGSDWERMGIDLDGEPAEKFGQSVALSSDGTILAASSIESQTNTGVVRIWEWSGTEWVKMDKDIVGSRTYSYTGSQIDLSDDGKTIAIVSVRGGANNNGYAMVFEWTGSVWQKKGLNIDFSVSLTDAISINSNGTIVAVGGYYHDNFKGIVKVYQWNGNAWEQRGTELKNNIVDQKGDSVFLNDIGNILAVGSPVYDTSEGIDLGRVTIYKWDTNIKDWVFIKQILGEPGDLIGTTGTISLNGDGTMISIGSKYHDSNKGTVRIYSNRKYLFSGELTVSGGGDFTGDLTVNGNNITNGNSTINGNIDFTGNLLKNGEIYKETNLVNSFTNNWSQLGTNLDGGQLFDLAGRSIAISSDGNIVVVGAENHSNGNQTFEGTARVYKWDGSTWNMLGNEGYFDGLPGDKAGTSVAISSNGTIVAVGSSNYSKVTSSDGSKSNEGNVQVYKWNGTAWNRLAAKISGTIIDNELYGESGDLAGSSVSLSSDGNILSTLR